MNEKYIKTDCDYHDAREDKCNGLGDESCEGCVLYGQCEYCGGKGNIYGANLNIRSGECEYCGGTGRSSHVY